MCVFERVVFKTEKHKDEVPPVVYYVFRNSDARLPLNKSYHMLWTPYCIKCPSSMALGISLSFSLVLSFLRSLDSSSYSFSLPASPTYPATT